MPFPFRILCDLLERLKRHSRRSSGVDRIQETDQLTILTWFEKYNATISRQGPEAAAFLSCLFPERRPDRIFGLQERQLEKIIQRAQCLGSSRMTDIRRLITNNGVDFASSVERVMATTDCEPRVGPEAILEEIDDVLDQVAALSSFSSASLREKVTKKHGRLSRADDLLAKIFRVLRSSECKWMIRMISKNYSPVRVPETLVMSRFHFLLPDLLRFQNSIPAAVELLGSPTIRHMPNQPAVDTYTDLKEVASNALEPQNDDKGRIEPFHRIRSHVKRSGRFLRAAQDSPIESNKNLMIVFYDILVLDDIVYGLAIHDERRKMLESLVRRIPGRSDIASREIIDFSSFDATEQLNETFARAITQRWEGLVLKGCDNPYFSFNRSRPFIKLKKDYIPGLSDTADFAIVRGRHDTRDETELRSIPEFDILYESAHRLQSVELFRRPFIVEVVSAGFDKPANVGYFTLRFPRVLKVHEDRSFRDTVGFEELQGTAQRCLEIADDGEEEEKRWLGRLRGYEPVADRSRTSSPSDDAVSIAAICAGRQSTWRQEKSGTVDASRSLDDTSLGASKRKMAPEAAWHGNSTAKGVIVNWR
ncbi:hypothetical protein S40288_10262 [Stachybotrys chartarum IBT 40288]|nr:hypothetical protein S40288_10262 [Stachybotrys chartarum IBT 40288]